MGYRPLAKVHRTIKKLPNGTEKVWETPEFGAVKYYTYNQINERIHNFARGVVQFCGINSGDRLAIFENTCMEWMISAHAAYQFNITLVTVYANLGEEALIHSLNQTQVTAILTNEDQLKRFDSIAAQVPTLRNVIYVPSAALEISDKEREERAQVIKNLTMNTPLEVMSFGEVEMLGSQDKSVAPLSKPTKDDLAIIMYTSGTTGEPKGVKIRHRNMVASVAGVPEGLEMDFKAGCVYLAYLPLAHILESAAETYILSVGGKLFYGNPRTLTDTNAKPYGDFTAAKPDLICGVPRIYDTIRKTVLAKLDDPSSGKIKKWLFNTAYAAKKAAIEEGRDTPLWNAILFNKLRALMGGRVRFILSGGAPLSAQTHEFVRVCFNAAVVQGYGLTETCAGLCTQSQFSRCTVSNVGAPIPSAEVKLVSIPEMNYYASDAKPRGELWTRGPCVTAGYFMKDSEDFDAEGWFHTGDVAEMQDDGTFKIIDRKKNLVKLDHGEYVALEKIEAIYANSKFISPNGICAYGDSERSHVVAIILPEVMNAKNWATQNNINEEIPALCKNPKFIKAVKESLDAEAKKGNLKSIELVHAFALVDDEWTPENDMLTAAMKLKRNSIKERYISIIEELYGNRS